jgi:hypothetical protein
MYSDPNRIRDHRLTVRLDRYEHDLITALANYQGEQPAVLLRQLIMREATALLANVDDSIVEQRSA